MKHAPSPGKEKPPPAKPADSSSEPLSWRRVLVASQVWWIKASPRRKAVVLVVGFFLILTLFKLMGCGSGVSRENKLRVVDGGPSAGLIQRAQEQVLSSDRVQSSEGNLGVDVYYTEKKLVISGAYGDTVILEDGQRLKYNGRCWEDRGRTARPRPLQVVLPLEEPSASFTDREEINGLTYIAYTADRLGSWGPGSGELVLNGDDRPVRFTYAQDGSGEEYVFNIRYPDKLPVVSVKRC